MTKHSDHPILVEQQIVWAVSFQVGILFGQPFEQFFSFNHIDRIILFSPQSSNAFQMADIKLSDIIGIIDAHPGDPLMRCSPLVQSLIICYALFVRTHVLRPKPITEKKSIANFHARNTGAIKRARKFVSLFFVRLIPIINMTRCNPSISVK